MDFDNMTNELKREIALNGTDEQAYNLYCFMMGELHGIGAPFKTFEQWLNDEPPYAKTEY